MRQNIKVEKKKRYDITLIKEDLIKDQVMKRYKSQTTVDTGCTKIITNKKIKIFRKKNFCQQ